MRVDSELEYAARKGRWQQARVKEFNYIFEIVFDTGNVNNNNNNETDNDSSNNNNSSDKNNNDSNKNNDATRNENKDDKNDSDINMNESLKETSQVVLSEQLLSKIEWSPLTQVSNTLEKLRPLSKTRKEKLIGRIQGSASNDNDNDDDNEENEDEDDMTNISNINNKLDWLSTLEMDDIIDYKSDDYGWRAAKMRFKCINMTVTSWNSRGRENEQDFTTFDEKSRLLMKDKLKPCDGTEIEDTPIPIEETKKKNKKKNNKNKKNKKKKKKKKKSKFEASDESGVSEEDDDDSDSNSEEEEEENSGDYEMGDSRGQSMSPLDATNRIEHILYCMDIPINVKCWTKTFAHLLPKMNEIKENDNENDNENEKKDKTMQIEKEKEKSIDSNKKEESNGGDSDKENGNKNMNNTNGDGTDEEEEDIDIDDINIAKKRKTNITATDSTAKATATNTNVNDNSKENTIENLTFETKYLVKILNRSYHHCGMLLFLSL